MREEDRLKLTLDAFSSVKSKATKSEIDRKLIDIIESED
jgi:hypothetical protein